MALPPAELLVSSPHLLPHYYCISISVNAFQSYRFYSTVKFEPFLLHHVGIFNNSYLSPSAGHKGELHLTSLNGHPLKLHLTHSHSGLPVQNKCCSVEETAVLQLRKYKQKVTNVPKNTKSGK